MASHSEFESCFETYVVIFTDIFRCSVLTMLLKSFAEIKRFSRGILADTAGFLRFFSLQALSFLAPGG